MIHRNTVSVIIGAALFLAVPALSADNCKYERRLDTRVDLSNAATLAVIAKAGYLEINGEAGSDQAVVKARACASKQDWVDDIQLDTDSGPDARIEAVLPDLDGHDWGKQYAYLDLEISLPSDIDLEVKDSSGRAEIYNVGAIRLFDSSGDLLLDGTAGPANVSDSSGDLELRNIGGSLEVRDSSGDIDAEDINGDFTIRADSSGSIFAKEVRGQVHVHVDSSGDIRFKRVDRDVIIDRDSSGSIWVEDVAGDFEVGRDGSGSIRYKNVGGQVDIPENKY